MKHLRLSVAHVALQFREDGDGGDGRHGLKLHLLPVLAFCTCHLGHICGEVAGYDALLRRVGNHLQYSLAIALDGQFQFLAASTTGSKHHLVRCLQVFLSAQIVGVAVLAVGLAGYGQLQLGGEVVERVAHVAHELCLVVPLLHLLRVGFHLLVEGFVDGTVVIHCVSRGTPDAFSDDSEAVEHLIRDVQGQHSHQHHIHEVDHLLARGYGSFLYCHFLSPLS